MTLQLIPEKSPSIQFSDECGFMVRVDNLKLRMEIVGQMDKIRVDNCHHNQSRRRIFQLYQPISVREISLMELTDESLKFVFICSLVAF